MHRCVGGHECVKGSVRRKACRLTGKSGKLCSRREAKKKQEGLRWEGGAVAAGTSQ